jgi:hypothetical protein
MGKKTLIPEEKWEGLRHALEEAAGTRRTSKTPGPVPEAAGEVARPERGKKRGAGEEGKKESNRGKRKKGKKKEKKEKKEKKRKKKEKKGKGKKKKSGKKKGKG